MTDTRQVRRARERANDYWATGRWGHMVPSEPRSCRRPSATNRDHVSRNIIPAKAPPKRLSPRLEPRFAKGMKHAWQRKAAFWDAVRARAPA